MQTDLISLSKVFTENLFRIPDFQRGYSWGEKQLKEFWSDIEQLEHGKNHYTGVLTLEAVPAAAWHRWEGDQWIIESKNFRPYFIVDGQQRLTTAIILIVSILEKIGDAGTLNYDSAEEIRKRYVFLSKDGGLSRSYIFGYEKDNPSYEFLKVKIFGEQSERFSLVEPTIYTRNLEAAKVFFASRIEGLSLAQVESIYAKLTQNLLFNIFTIADDVDVHVAFETMNNRGKPLSFLELLKNRLIYLSTRLPVADADGHDRAALRALINESWKTAYHYLGKGRPISGGDDYFLQLQSVLYFEDGHPEQFLGRTRRESDASSTGEFLLTEVFTAPRMTASGKEKLTAKDIRNYALDLKRSVELFYQIFNPLDSGMSSDEGMWLERLRRIDAPDVSVLLLAVYKKRTSKTARIAFLKEVERFAFLRAITPYFFYEVDPEPLAVALLGGEIAIADVIGVIKKKSDEYADSRDFRNSMRELGKDRSYYQWSPARYFLFEYEQFLLSQTRTNRKKLEWEDFADEDWLADFRSLEHIYPQKAADADWKKHFNHLSVAQRNRLKHTIGNLTPLSTRKNSSLGNRSFSEKKGSAAKKTGFAYGCYSEIEISQEANWTPASIRDRGIRLLEFMESRWDVQLGTRAEKIAVLGLEFV